MHTGSQNIKSLAHTFRLPITGSSNQSRHSSHKNICQIKDKKGDPALEKSPSVYRGLIIKLGQI